MEGVVSVKYKINLHLLFICNDRLTYSMVAKTFIYYQGF